MTPVVVDTDVVSFLFKNHPIGLRYDPELAGRVPSISFMTAAEMERWAIQYRWGEHRLHWLHLYLKRFTVVPSSPDLCRKWAEVMVAAQAAGRRIECADAWIAATRPAVQRALGDAQPERLSRRAAPDLDLSLVVIVTGRNQVGRAIALRGHASQNRGRATTKGDHRSHLALPSISKVDRPAPPDCTRCGNPPTPSSAPASACP